MARIQVEPADAHRPGAGRTGVRWRQLEYPAGCSPVPVPVVSGGACGPGLAKLPFPKAEQFQQVVAGADEQPLPVHLRQAPQQELPEAPALLDLAEHRFNCLHTQGVAFPPSFRPQLAAHPVPDRQSLGNASPGRWLQHQALAGLLRRDEWVHSQGRVGWWPEPPRSPAGHCPPPPDSCRTARNPALPGRA